MPLTRNQLDHLQKRLQDERARALDLLNRIVGERSGESGQDAAGDLSVMPSHAAVRAARRDSLGARVSGSMTGQNKAPPARCWRGFHSSCPE